MRILVVEDEKALCDAITRSLRHLAYSVDCCHDGQTAIDLLAIETFDLVVLDLNLPEADGMTVLETLRETDHDTKVLILSARCDIADKVCGLDAGANDYLTKPFHLEELAARIRSLTRRRFVQDNTVLTCGTLSFDTSSRKACSTKDGRLARRSSSSTYGTAARTASAIQPGSICRRSGRSCAKRSGTTLSATA